MNYRIAVVGSGAIDSYYGAKLAFGGSDVHFLMRGDLSEIRSAGLSVRGSGENFVSQKSIVTTRQRKSVRVI